MLRTVIGNKTENISKTELEKLIIVCEKVHVDLGTGDGRYIFKHAQVNPTTFYIGIDPSEKQLKSYAKKAKKAKLKNCLFIVGSIEFLPDELKNIANSLTIILPWGSLLQAIVNVDTVVFTKITDMLKPESTPGEKQIEIIFGYSQDAEPTEVKRLGIDKLDTTYIYEKMVPALTTLGFKIECVKNVTKADLNDFETSWSKKLRFGQDRPLFYIKITR